VTQNIRDELERVRRVADQLCSSHAALRDQYSLRALLADLLILALSTWLVALAFVDPALNIKLTPGGIDDRMWVGILAVATFFLTLVQFKTDWKGRSDSHKQTGQLYAEVKREAGYVLANDALDESACRRVFARYDLASAVGVAIPENQFLSQKQRHLRKVALSKHLSRHPSASLFVVRVRFWARDTFLRGRKGDGEPS
jgi:hypothetical protein